MLGPEAGRFGGGTTSIGERNEGQRGWIVRIPRWEENETPSIRVWKPFPSRRVLKLEGSSKLKETGQYLLAVGLGRYRNPIS